MWVSSLGQEEPLEEEMATHSSILACKILWHRSLQATVRGILKSWTQLNDWACNILLHICTILLYAFLCRWAFRLLSCPVKVKKKKVKVLVAQSCLILCDPMDCSFPGSSVHGIVQARMLEWEAIVFSRGSSWLRDWTWVSCIAGEFLTFWATVNYAAINVGMHASFQIMVSFG